MGKSGGMKSSSCLIFGCMGDVKWKTMVDGVETCDMDRDDDIGLVLSL